MIRFSLRTLMLFILGVALLFGGVRWLVSDSASFYFTTGFVMPLDARVRYSIESHGGFHGDGGRLLMFENSARQH